MSLFLGADRNSALGDYNTEEEDTQMQTSPAVNTGVEVNVIRCWLGHVSIATTNRYIEIDLAMKAKALAVCEVTSPTTDEASGSRDPDILAWLESL